MVGLDLADEMSARSGASERVRFEDVRPRAVSAPVDSGSSLDRPVGSALLVAGYGAFTLSELEISAVAQLGKIGEALLGADARWRIQRLAPSEAERSLPVRSNLRRELDALFMRSGEDCFVVLVGSVARTVAGPAFVCAPALGNYAEDTTLPLSWISEKLGARTAGGVVLILFADGDAAARQRWLEILADGAPGQLMSVASGASDGLQVVLDGLWGDAVDRATGTVTPRELGQHLQRRLPAAEVQTSDATTPLLEPRPLVAGHDPRIRWLASAELGAGAEAADDLVGTVLRGRYRVDAELARGRSGAVYRVHHDLLQRDFAVKVLSTSSASSFEETQLCLHEIQSLCRLDHRNVVRVQFADILSRQRLFFVMELLCGRDMQRILDEDRPLELARVRSLAAQLLAGLGAAHSAGLIHADIKPANLLVVPDGDGERLVLVDFGMSRLRGVAPVRSIGGTRAFMAPEQHREERIDARSDLYAAALVIVAMLTGWEPASPGTIPPLDAIADPTLRDALTRALADDAERRFSSAEEMAAALCGTASAASAAVPLPPRPPFRHAAPFTEVDRDDFRGRDRELDALLDAAIFRPAVVYTGPTGTGKTSLLRAGLIPQLVDRGIHAVYFACRTGILDGLAAAIDPGADDVADAVARHHQARRGRLVLVIDQIESALISDPAGAPSRDVVSEALGFARWPSDAQVSVVLSVREEFLARLLDRTQRLEPGIPVLRLGPLAPAAARHAIQFALAARRLAITAELLDALLADLERAAASLGVEMGWGNAPSVYPPHLQLVGAMLHESLPPGSSTLTLDLYRKLGGLETILAEHLHRVLEGELTPDRTAIARDLLLALVTSAQTRAARPESELIAMTRRTSRGRDGSRYAPGTETSPGEVIPASDDAAAPRSQEAILDTIEFLRDRGLLVSVVGGAGETVWELAHDSVVPRIQAWVTSNDLARRRALELIRYHLRRSRAGTPSLLSVADLREVDAHCTPEDLGELDAEWRGYDANPGDVAERPATNLLRMSRRAVRARRLVVAVTTTMAFAIASILALRWKSERDLRQHEASLRDRDMGELIVELSAFDRDPVSLIAVDVSLASLPELRWELHRPDPVDDGAPGERYPAIDVIRHRLGLGAALVRTERVSARGGPAVFVVHGRGRIVDGRIESCAPSIVPVRRLPGYASAGPRPIVHLRIPTCAASKADTIEVPAGPFIAGGPGDPPSSDQVSYGLAEQTVSLPRYLLDRTEVTNGALQAVSATASIAGLERPIYPATNELRHAGELDRPVASATWFEARVYCRLMGKRLPTSAEWQKAVRGGEIIDGAPNPAPRRNFPWGGQPSVDFANVNRSGPSAPAPVGSFRHDTGPYGHVDLAGNLQEWTNDRGGDGLAVTRGGNWSETNAGNLVNFVAIENPRSPKTSMYTIGFRCAADAQ